MADGARKRKEIASTPIRNPSNPKSFRSDLNKAINKQLGMNDNEADDDMMNVEDIVKQAISSIMPTSTSSSSAGMHNSATQKPSKVKRSGNNSIEETVACVLKQLVPVLITSISAAVESATKKVLLQTKSTSQKIQRLALIGKYNTDQLEQYSRRETIRISGIESNVGDNEDDLAESVYPNC